MRGAYSKTMQKNLQPTLRSKDVIKTRERLKESQAAFATRFGVNQSTVHRWEEGNPPQKGPASILLKSLMAQLDRETAAANQSERT